MITGLIVLDSDNHVYFEPNQYMLNRVMGHASFLDEITQKGVVLYKDLSPASVYGRHPTHHSSACVYVGENLETIATNHPLTPILIIGNQLSVELLDQLNNLIIIKYKSVGIDPAPNKFSFVPDSKPISTVMLINYDIHTYRLTK